MAGMFRLEQDMTKSERIEISRIVSRKYKKGALGFAVKLLSSFDNVTDFQKGLQKVEFDRLISMGSDRGSFKELKGSLVFCSGQIGFVDIEKGHSMTYEEFNYVLGWARRLAKGRE